MQTKRFRWFLILFIAVNLAYIITPAFAAEKRTSDGKVAIVNGAMITQGNLRR
jgi:hypothetical protein